MRFWDASALVPLLINEPMTTQAQQWLRDDPAVAVWWATPVECISALCRRERERTLTRPAMDEATALLRRLQQDWLEIEPTERLRDLSGDLLRTHPLRASDALQLATALMTAGDQPQTLPFVCLDHRLRAAAAGEGLLLHPETL